jgi:hypothetical protein
MSIPMVPLRPQHSLVSRVWFITDRIVPASDIIIETIDTIAVVSGFIPIIVWDLMIQTD